MNSEREQYERICRLYASNTDAAIAAGMRTSSFSRKCRRLGIKTPNERKAERQKG